MPLSTVTLATLPPEQRTEGTGLFNLLRNIGSSVGISVVTSLLTQNTHANHAFQYVTAVNRVFENPAIAQFCNPTTDAGRAALDAVLTQQAQIIAHIDDFKLLRITTFSRDFAAHCVQEAAQQWQRDARARHGMSLVPAFSAQLKRMKLEAHKIYRS